MPDKNGNIRNKDIYERLAVIETKLEIFCKKVGDYVDKNDAAHCNFVSTKVFSGWLAMLAVAIGIVTTILFLVD